MKVVLTGGSSFTGFWFAKALVEAGHEVTALLSGADSAAAYNGIRAERVNMLKATCHTVFAAPFGGAAFFASLRRIGPFDRFCHHWAEVRDYRSPNFDAVAAVGANTRAILDLLRALRQAGCGRLVLTGSVFAQGEGIGEPPLLAFSPYGLSKGLTKEVFAYYCEREGVALDRFVIPNPFGPWEEPRFTDYLTRTWHKGEVARVATPRYVRDNIHVDLLAKAYADFVAAGDSAGGRRLGPSLYVETQGAFAERVAREVRARLGLACDLELGEQNDFPEPRMRVNTDACDAAARGWDEAAAWARFVGYYAARYAAAPSRRP